LNIIERETVSETGPRYIFYREKRSEKCGPEKCGPEKCGQFYGTISRIFEQLFSTGNFL
jgi:hypothetical protein